jgi:hypothetical protein
MHAGLICIDLGSAYTKVAVRTGWTEDHRLPDRPSFVYYCPVELQRFDEEFLVPTVVVRLEGSQKRWACGLAAAKQAPGPRAKPFPNWKSEIFKGDLDRKEVATAFMSWLRQGLISGGHEVGTSRVRLCVPRLEGGETGVEAMRECMVAAGWPDENLESTYEPIANVFGVASQGRNFMWRPDGLPNGPLHDAVGRILGAGAPKGEATGALGRAMRAFANKRLDRQDLRILIADSGAFTLDVAQMRIPLAMEAQERWSEEPDVPSHSWDLGIETKLDSDVWNALRSRHGVNFGERSFEDRETIKQFLYAGRAYDLGDGTTVGDEGDQGVINEICESFAQKMWERLSPWVQPTPDWVVLTGGGVAIGRIREVLKQRFSGLGAEVCLASDVPAIESTSRATTSGSGLTAGRFASAIGGACILLKPSARRLPQRSDSVSAPSALTPETGDVMAIDPTRPGEFVVCESAESPLVVGVYGQGPRRRTSDMDAVAQMATTLATVVPVKVCDEAGPIRPGDLLVSASVPGHARKAPSPAKPGTVLGKAVGIHAVGRGTIHALLMAQ